MSSIVFDASLDTNKLDREIEKSKKNINDYAKGVESAGKRMDKSFSFTVDQYKRGVEQQKKLIKELEKEVKQLEKVVSTSSPFSKMKSQAIEDLASTRKALAHHRERLTVREKEYSEAKKEQIELNKEEEKSISPVIDKLKKWGLQLITITGLIKGFKTIVESSSSAAESFRHNITGLGGAFQQLAQSMVPAADQTGSIVKNMIEGFKHAKELASGITEYNNAMRSHQVVSAEETKTLADLEKAWRNTANAVDVRKEALEKWVVIRKGQADRELDIERRLNDAIVKEVMARPGVIAREITREQIDAFSKIYATDSELMTKAKEYWKSLTSATAAGAGVGVSESTQRYYANLKKEIEDLIPAGMKWGEVMDMAAIEAQLSEKQVQSLADSFIGLKKAEAGTAEVEASIARWMGSIVNKSEESVGSLEKLREKLQELQDAIAVGAIREQTPGSAQERIKKDMERDLLVIQLKYTRDLEKYKENEEIKKALTERYAQERYEIEIKYLEKLKAENQKITESARKVDPGREYAVLRRSLRGKDVSMAELFTLRGTSQKQADIDKQVKKNLEEQLDLRLQILNAASSLVYKIGEKIGLQDEELNQLGHMLDSFNDLMRGDVFSAVSGLIMSVIEAFPTAASKYNAEIEELNRLLEQQSRIIDQSLRKGGTEKQINREIELLEEQQKATEKALKKAEKWAKFTGMGIGSKSAWKKVAKLREELEGMSNDLEDARQSLTDFLSGDITEITIVDMIGDAFRDGKTAIDDFADYTNQMLTDAVMSVFKAEMVGPELTALQEYIAEALKDKTLSSDEKQRIDQQIKDIAEVNQKLWENLTGALDMGKAPTTGLAGGIQRQLTEETGSELAGLFRRFADDERAVKDYTKIGVSHLAMIEQNTADTVTQLQVAVGELRSINSNTKPVFSGEL